MHRLLNLFHLLLIATPDALENQRILRDLLHWLARFVFEILFEHHSELLGNGLVTELPQPSNENHQGFRNTSDTMIESRIFPDVTGRYKNLDVFLT